MTTLETRFGSAAVGAPPPPAGPASAPDGDARRSGRRLLRAGLAVLAVAALAAAVLLGRLWEAHGRADVWMVTGDVASGAALSGGDVRRVQVDRPPADALPAGASPVGSFAVAPLHAGAVLRPADVAAAAATVPGPDDALVGFAAVPGRVPDGIRTGDQVQLVALPPEPEPGRTPGDPKVLLRTVTVQHVVVTAQGVGGTLVVPLKVAPQVAALSAANRVALLGLPR